MKKVKMNNNRISNIVKKTLESDGVFVNETKIDSVIKKYLMERDDMLMDDEPVDNLYSFTEETKDTFHDMAQGLLDTVEDLNVIKTTEGDVLVETDVYAEDYIETLILDLESVVERLEFLKGLE
jgi:hypothetical protein